MSLAGGCATECDESDGSDGKTGRHEAQQVVFGRGKSSWLDALSACRIRSTQRMSDPTRKEIVVIPRGRRMLYMIRFDGAGTPGVRAPSTRVDAYTLHTLL